MRARNVSHYTIPDLVAKRLNSAT
ncbi:hypothetical protein FOXYSP1_04329 [Fusarium oxysporum f. sp. phaseoli]